MRPLKLKLLPNLRWRGHLTVVDRTEAGYVVHFDAEIVRYNAGAEPICGGHVYDCTTLTPKQLKDWTGYEDG